MTDIQTRIETLLREHPILLFMKGSKHFPQCGFSATVVEALRQAGAGSFHTVNVLEDPEIRQGIKQYAQWPTIPQLYIRGAFVGGCDIVREMFEQGELQTLVAEALSSDPA